MTEEINFTIEDECHYMGNVTLDVFCEYEIETIDNGVGHVYDEPVIIEKTIQITLGTRDVTAWVRSNDRMWEVEDRAQQEANDHYDTL